MRVRERIRRKEPKENKKRLSESRPKSNPQPRNLVETKLRVKNPSDKSRKPVRESQSELIKNRLREKRAKKGDARQRRSRAEKDIQTNEIGKSLKRGEEREKTRFEPKINQRSPKAGRNRIQSREFPKKKRTREASERVRKSSKSISHENAPRDNKSEANTNRPATSGIALEATQPKVPKHKEKQNTELMRNEPDFKKYRKKPDFPHLRASETPKQYEVNMYKPQIRGVEFKSEGALREFVESELGGFKHRSDYEKITNDAVGHIRLRELVGDSETLALKEIRALSEEVGLPLRTTRQKISEAGRPQLYKLAENAITRSEAEAILQDIDKRTGGLRSYADMNTRLEKMDLLDHLQTLKSHEKNDRLARKYLSFLKNLSEGGTVRDISKKSGVKEGTGLSWTRGVLPDYVKRASEERAHVRDASHIPEKHAKERHGGHINIKRPEIDGNPVQSEKHLKKLVTTEHPGVLDMPKSEKMLHEACVHIRLVNQLEGRDYMQYGEIPRLADENDAKQGTMRVWATKGVIPRLYLHIENSISQSEARARFEKIRERNNGVITTEDFNRRMQNYYLYEEYKASSFHRRDVREMERYSDFMRLYRKGGSLENIARQVGVPTSTASGWLKGLQPRPIRIASGIPKEHPRQGYKWLPRRFVDGMYPQNCIEVPETVRSYKDVLGVLRQIEPLENRQMKRRKRKYGRLSQEEEFMYLLGAYMSDASTFNKTTLGQSIGIRLAKRYPWSYDFGEGLCQALGVCGIHARRVRNTPANTTFKKTEQGLIRINQSEKLNWASENSPLAHWIYRSCLGYRSDIPKYHQSVNADWILSAPLRMRRAVLQGLGDGDGSASVPGNYVCFSSKHNKRFIQGLFDSFGVKTRTTPGDVFTKGMDEAKKAALIPPFRYAASRFEASQRMAARIDAKRSVRDMPLQKEEIDFILAMRQRGSTPWEVSEALFDEFGTAVDPRTIKNVKRG